MNFKNMVWFIKTILLSLYYGTASSYIFRNPANSETLVIRTFMPVILPNNSPQLPRDSEAIGLLERPRSPSVCILIISIYLL